MYNHADWTQSDGDETSIEIGDDLADDAPSPIAGWWILPSVCTGAVAWFALLSLVFW